MLLSKMFCAIAIDLQLLFVTYWPCHMHNSGIRIYIRYSMHVYQIYNYCIVGNLWGQIFMIFVVAALTTNILPTNEETLSTFTCSNYENEVTKYCECFFPPKITLYWIVACLSKRSKKPQCKYMAYCTVKPGTSKLTSHHSAICHIFAQPKSLDKSWNDLFYIVPTTHFFVVSK